LQHLKIIGLIRIFSARRSSEDSTGLSSIAKPSMAKLPAALGCQGGRRAEVIAASSTPGIAFMRRSNSRAKVALPVMPRYGSVFGSLGTPSHVFAVTT